MKNSHPLNYLPNLIISQDEANFSHGNNATNPHSHTHMFNENNNADPANLTPAIHPAHQAAVSQEASTAVTQPEPPSSEMEQFKEAFRRMTAEEQSAFIEECRQQERVSLLNSIIQHKAAVLGDLSVLEDYNEQELQRKGMADCRLTRVEAEVVGILKIRSSVPLTLLQNVFIDQDLKKARKALVDKGLLAEAQEGNSKVLSLTEEGKAAA